MPLARSSPAQEFRESCSGEAVGRDRREQGQHRQALAKVDVRRLLEEADMPANGGAVVLLRLIRNPGGPICSRMVA